MKTITLKTKDGHTIEVKKDGAGKILVRHSRFDKENFGEFDGIWGERIKSGLFTERMLKSGFDPDAEGMKEAREKILQVFGAYLMLPSDSHSLDSVEGDMIRDAVKQLNV